MQRLMYVLESMLGTVGLITLLGCHELTGSQALPSGTSDPSSYQSKSGALGMRTAALNSLEQGLRAYLIDTGLLSDELESNAVGASAGALLSASLPTGGSLDERILPELGFGASVDVGNGSFSGSGLAAEPYDSLQSVRGHVSQALGALAAYDTAAADTATAKVLRGELFALAGYAEILLADLFCSGVPLSTLDFNRDFTYHASSTRDQVDSVAVTHEDSALALSTTSTQVLNLARVLKGRALLDRGLYTQAGQAVAAVPDGFQYQLAIQWSGFVPPGSSSSACSVLNCLNRVATVSDGEGQNGLPYIFSGDPRTSVMIVPANGFDQVVATLYFPNKYSPTGFSPFTVADWIEARLIQAEAALQAGDPATMVRILNNLRKTARVPGDTVALPDTTDPGTRTGEVSLLFHERAFWLFLTGHRQGDMRRLIRQYGRRQDQVYPIGVYTAPGAGTYGTDVTAPIPGDEFANPLYHGCLNRAP